MIKYYDKKTECMPQEQLKELQLKLLNKQLLKVNTKSNFYRNRLKKISNLQEVECLPFTEKKDLISHTFDDFLVIKKEDVFRYIQTSGTTQHPAIIAMGKQDRENKKNIDLRNLAMIGAQKGDIMQVMFPISTSVSGFAFYDSASEYGMTLFPMGAGNTEKQLYNLKLMNTTISLSTFGYLQHLLELSSVDFIKKTKWRKAIICGEASSEEAVNFIMKNYGIEIFNGYGLSECLGGIANECSCHKGLHVAEDYFYVEIVNPETGEVLPDGEYGELVVTPLQQEAMPFIRYRTRDITRIIPGQCSCGRTYRRIEPITRRIDDMMIINGANVFPSQIEECIYKHISTATNYLIHITEKEGLKKLLIDIELQNDLLYNLDRLKKLETELINTMKACITVTPKLNFIPLGNLPEIQGKVKRVVKD